MGRASSSRWRLAAVAVLGALTIPAPAARAQEPMTRIERERVEQMLRSISSELKKNYYDPTFGGRDMDSHLKAAAAKLEAATSLGHGMAVIAQALVDLNDSHTFFIPPTRTISVDYGWRLQMIGNDCFIVAVRPGSDAAAKGLAPGDQVLAIDGFRPSRRELWKVEYSYSILRPRTGATLTVRSPGGAPRQLEIASKISQSKRVRDLSGSDGGLDLDALIREMEDSQTRHRRQQLDSVVIWKMPDFSFANHDEILDWALKDAQALVLDLRGNPGGYVKALEQVVGRLFDRDVKIADLKGRKSMPPIQAKKSRRPFGGRIVALVDSRSGSAAELLARILQLEKRGTVLGDRSSGSVMQSYLFEGQMGVDRMVFYGASITNADVIMSDGASLEHAGVVPDETIVPTAEDLAAGRDPVLSRAFALLGLGVSPAEAGKLFPIEWK